MADGSSLFTTLKGTIIPDYFDPDDDSLPVDVHVCNDNVGFVEVGSGEYFPLLYQW